MTTFGFLRNYVIHILREDNDMDELVFPTVGKRMKWWQRRMPIKLLKVFWHRGHSYTFDREKSFITHKPFSVRWWLTPGIFRKYDRLMLFREPPRGQAAPTEPLIVPAKVNFMEESPLILKGTTKSKVLARYRSKQRFGGTKLSWQAILMIGILIIVFLVIATGKVHIPGMG